jgi:hemerythrin-like metal-binding protein
MTGDRCIDGEHLRLVQMLSGLATSLAVDPPGEMLKLLGDVRKAIFDHCTSEETRMIASRYPKYSTHLAAHASLLVSVAELNSGFRGDPTVLTVEKIVGYVEMLATHVQEHDAPFAAFLRQTSNEDCKAV